jgi:hypothetical protein
MASDRYFLACKQVNLCLFMGKCTGDPIIYKTPTGEKLQEFFDLVNDLAPRVDLDFFILRENKDAYSIISYKDIPHIWKYTIEFDWEVK